MLTIFYRLKGMTAVGTLKLKWSSYFLAIDKGLAADFAFELSTTTSIVVDVLMRSSAKRARDIFRNSTVLTFLSFYRFHGFAITEQVVFVPESPVLFDEGFDDRKLISEEFLVLRTVDFIMSPLFQRNISADKENKPADLLILFLNDVK